MFDNFKHNCVMKRVKKKLKLLSKKDRGNIKGGSYMIEGGKTSSFCPPPEPEDIIAQSPNNIVAK